MLYHFSGRRSGASRNRKGFFQAPRSAVLFRRFPWCLVLAIVAPAGALAASQVTETAPIKIVAAENFYGDIARQIGGPAVAVTSILNNPAQDPHEFEARPSTARALAAAALVVYNGLGYDSWVPKLLAASPSPSRQTIIVAALLHKPAGANPHIWYDPATAPVLAQTLADRLGELDYPQHADYQKRLAAFGRSQQPLEAQVAELRRKFAGTPVTATEPVFNDMAQALGFKILNLSFQVAVMNDTEPTPAETARFEKSLQSKSVKLLIYNNQTSGALTLRMRAIAAEAGIPVVGVSETEPPGSDYQQWMRSELDAIGRALSH